MDVICKNNLIINFKKYFNNPRSKLFFGFLFGIFSLYLILILILSNIDQNTYKDKIRQAVHDNLEGELQLNGPVQLRCFPWITLEAHDVSFYKNIKNKRDPIKIQSIKITPKILPLILNTVVFKLEVNNFKVKSLSMFNASSLIEIKNNLISLNNSKIYWTKANKDKSEVLKISAMIIDLTSDLPKYSIKHHQQHFPLGILSPFCKESFKITGDATINMELTAVGKSIHQIKKSLSGKVEVEIEKGTLYGIDFISSLKEAKSLLESMTAKMASSVSDTFNTLLHHKKTQNVGTTPFTKLIVKAKLENGYMHVEDVNIKHPIYSIKGKGKSHLASNSLDYYIEALYKKKQDHKHHAKTKYPLTPLIIYITGSMENPKIKPDFNSYLKYIKQS